MKNMKRILGIITLLLISFIFVTTVRENIIVDNKTKEITKDAILDERKSNDFAKYYYKEDKDYYKRKEHLNPGSFCDILVTLNSNTVPPFKDLIDLTIGGHVAICGMYYKDQYFKMLESDTIDTTFNDDYKCVSLSPKAEWDDSFLYPNYYILRVDLTEEQAYCVFNEAISMLGDPYNITFLLNTKNTHYCSDLVAKCFRKAHININPDFGATTVIDILASKYTHVVAYKVRKNNVDYYYTL